VVRVVILAARQIVLIQLVFAPIPPKKVAPQTIRAPRFVPVKIADHWTFIVQPAPIVFLPAK
jgi:hypothetical protein